MRAYRETLETLIPALLAVCALLWTVAFIVGVIL